MVDPAHVGGHLVYASKYVDPSHPDLDRPTPTRSRRDYLGHVQTIFPDLRDDEILGSVVQRARVVEPVHLLGGATRLPEMFPVPGLALASTAHVYPEIVNGQAVIGVSERLVPGSSTGSRRDTEGGGMSTVRRHRRARPVAPSACAVARTSSRSAASRPLSRCSRPHVEHLGRPRQRHRLRLRRGSRVADGDFPTSTSPTTTGRLRPLALGPRGADRRRRNVALDRLRSLDRAGDRLCRLHPRPVPGRAARRLPGSSVRQRPSPSPRTTLSFVLPHTYSATLGVLLTLVLPDGAQPLVESRRSRAG